MSKRPNQNRSGIRLTAPPNTHQQSAIALLVNCILSTDHLALKRRCDMESAYRYAGLTTPRESLLNAHWKLQPILLAKI